LLLIAGGVTGFHEPALATSVHIEIQRPDKNPTYGSAERSADGGYITTTAHMFSQEILGKMIEQGVAVPLSPIFLYQSANIQELRPEGIIQIDLAMLSTLYETLGITALNVMQLENSTDLLFATLDQLSAAELSDFWIFNENGEKLEGERIFELRGGTSGASMRVRIKNEKGDIEDRIVGLVFGGIPEEDIITLHMPTGNGSFGTYGLVLRKTTDGETTVDLGPIRL
jgi:hypothetical protein